MATMFPCPSQHHEISHWRYVLHCCDKFPRISMPRHETNIQQKRAEQYVFMFTAIYHVIIFMVYADMKNE